MENEQNQNLNTAPPPAQPVAEPEKPSFLHSKWLKIGIGTLLVILVLAGTFVLGGKLINKPQAPASSVATSTPTPVDETANWKTYEGNGFSFKYPIDWKIDLNARHCLDVDCVSLNVYDPNSLEKFTGNGGSVTDVATTFFSVQEVFENTQTAKSYVDNYTSQVPYNTVSNLKRQSSTINELEVELFSAEGEGSQGYNIVVSNGTKLAFINSSLSNLNGISIENKILSTFKFTATNNDDVLNKITQELGSGYNNVKVQGIYGDYAMGSSGFSTSGGGILYYAHKENGVWKIIWKGNESPGCSRFTNYSDLPKELICEPSY